MNVNEWMAERRALLAALARVASIMTSSADWETKYHLVFSLHQDVINPGLKAIGIGHSWYDPDTTYEEDARAYADSLEPVRRGIEAALSDPCE